MTQLHRTERLLALILLRQMKGLSQREKVLQLNLAGLSNLEIADILQLTPQAVARALDGNHIKPRATERRSAPRKH